MGNSGGSTITIGSVVSEIPLHDFTLIICRLDPGTTVEAEPRNMLSWLSDDHKHFEPMPNKEESFNTLEQEPSVCEV